MGINELYEAKQEQTAADLCAHSAEILLEELGWGKDSIDGLLFLSQTPDYITPATSCVLQHRLGLPTSCVSSDFNFGCTGFIHGIFFGSQLIELKTCRRVLVLIGDTLRRLSSEYDRGLYFILSDAGSAIGLEYEESAHAMTTVLHTDGSGYDGLIVPAGGTRIPKTAETCVLKEDKDGNQRSQEHYYMNGMDIFTFAVKQIPELIQETLELVGWGRDSIDQYFLHQANVHMVKHIAKRAKIDINKCPMNIGQYGNTSGCSIPLLLVDRQKNGRAFSGERVLLCGFGVGLAWGATATTRERIGGHANVNVFEKKAV